MEVSKKISMKRVKTNDPNSVDIFINALKNNQIIAYPTDTIYGLGTDINNNEGIDRINSIKIRKQPMSVALGNFEIIKSNIRAKEEMLKKIEETLKDGSTCIVQYNPGSLNDKIPKDGKIGIRIPNHEYLKSTISSEEVHPAKLKKRASEGIHIKY